MTNESGFIPPHGNYEELLSYRKAEVVYDITFRFCHRFLARGDRTIDQMIQAARSGKQNILEGSKASGTSKESEIKLTNVGRASLEELLKDYQDFLRVRDLVMWDKDSKEALFVRKLGRHPGESFEIYREFCETRSAEVVANIATCLIHQANYLVNQQNPADGAGFHQGGRIARAHDAGSPSRAWETREEGVGPINHISPIRLIPLNPLRQLAPTLPHRLHWYRLPLLHLCRIWFSLHLRRLFCGPFPRPEPHLALAEIQHLRILFHSQVRH
jgi:hypothetical protein